MTTLKVSLYLVARKSLDNDTIADLTQALTSARRDLVGEFPILAQFKAPDTDPGAYLPVHAGAAEYYNGTQQSFLDKWSNAIFLAPMALGALITVVAGAWRFLRSGNLYSKPEALDLLYALAQRIRNADKELDLSEIENEIDEVLRAQREALENEDNTLHTATLNVAAHRLEDLIHERRAALAGLTPGSRRRAVQHRTSANRKRLKRHTPGYSMISSARASSELGTVRPSAFAVFRFMMSSYLLGDWTGRSAAFSPRNMRST